MNTIRWILCLCCLCCLTCLFTPALAQQTPRRLPILPQTGPLAGQTVYTNSYALLVGINRYQNLPKENWLAFARKDVLALRETLIRSYGFPAENIITLLDEQATKDNIQSALAYLADKKRVQPTDRLLVCFSCHGQAIPTPSGGKEGFLIPYDAQIDLKDGANRIPYYRYALPRRDLWAYVESGAARHCTVIADARFGGLLARPRGSHLGEVTLKKKLRLPAYQVLSAGGQNEEAWEDPALGHSVLMHGLLKELQKRAEEADTTFTLTDLFGSVRDVVIEKSGGKQTPLLQSYDGTEGDMVFVTTSAQKVPVLVSGVPGMENDLAVKTPRVRAAALVTLANEKFEQKAYPEAEQLYRQAMTTDLTYAPAHFRLGRLIAIVNKDNVEAERLYRKAIELDPNFAWAFSNLGNVYFEKRDYVEAERLYKKAIELDPKVADAYFNLGNLNRVIKKDYVEAERLYKKVIELDPKDAMAHANLALSLLRLKRKDEARKEAQLAKKLGLTEHEVYKLLDP